MDRGGDGEERFAGGRRVYLGSARVFFCGWRVFREVEMGRRRI